MITKFVLLMMIGLESIGISYKPSFINDQAQLPKVQSNIVAHSKTDTAKLPTIEIKNINPEPVVVSVESKPNTVTARAYSLYDAHSSQVLDQKNGDQAFPIASITKLMTSVIVLENFSQDDVIPVPTDAAYIEGSKVHLRPNESMKVADLISGMIISSGNDCAKSLSDYYGQDKVVGLMNGKAKALNLTHTQYFDAIGLDIRNVSSPNDLVKLVDYAMNNETIFQNMNTKTKVINSQLNGSSYNLSTTNRLLKNYSDIIGAKTGYNNEAGYCFVSVSEQSGHKIISAVLGSASQDSVFDESRRLLNWAFSSHQW
jgi:D-alanyl-D-alanine carboxypeptidase